MHVPTVFQKVFLLVTLLAFLCVSPGLGQKNQTAGPKYDTSSETKMKATVQELKLPPKGNQKEVAHLLIQNGSDAILDVYLCPEFFLADMGISFAKGDEIALTGSKVKQGEAELILAREVVKGSDTLVLRDDKGKPVWSARR